MTLTRREMIRKEAVAGGILHSVFAAQKCGR
jgi:hypothetical protein